MKPVSVSGPHGSGKTTLISRVISQNAEMFVENDFDIDFVASFPSFSTLTNFERSLLRLYHRYYLWSYNDKNSRVEPRKTILVSRSLYDSIAYIETYRELGSIADSEYETLTDAIEKITDKPFTIVLNPPVSIILERLEGRRSSKVRRDRDRIFSFEDTYDFIKCLHDRFEDFRSLDNVLYVTDNETQDIESVFAWMTRTNEEEAVASA